MFVSINCCVVTPNFWAIALSVSPGCTTYFWLAVDAGGDELAAGGWLLGAAGG